VSKKDRWANRRKSLTVRERQIVTLYHGLDGQKRRSADQIAAELGLSREVVLELHGLALQKLAHWVGLPVYHDLVRAAVDRYGERYVVVPDDAA